MKKISIIILVIAILCSFCSCRADISDTLLSDAPATEPSASTQSTEAVETEEDIDFYAGYARADITPDTFPISMNSEKKAIRVKDNIYATCVALSDGETTVLIMTLDVRQVSSATFAEMVEEIEKETKIPKENVIISATHNHTAPDHTSTASLNRKWVSKCVSTVKDIAKEAISDLTLTEAYMGRSDSEGLNFVRRYKLADGSYLSGGSTTQKILEHESKADTEIQLLKFEREGKKDILMVNWQAHAGHALNTENNVITADFISKFRDDIEKEDDLLFAYYQGAAGNINLHSLITGKQIQNSYSSVGRKMAQKCIAALDSLEKVKIGKIKVLSSYYTATVDTARYYRAEALYTSNDFDPVRLANYGFTSKSDVVWTYVCSAYRLHNGKDGVLDIPISAVSMGDVGFVSAPYEMFDANGVQIKEGSNFKMTFVCAYANGDYGYIPSSLAHSHGGYEVFSCCFVQGTGEALADKMISMLNELQN